MPEITHKRCPIEGCKSSDAFCYNTELMTGHCKSCGGAYPCSNMKPWAKEEYPVKEMRYSSGDNWKETKEIEQDNYWDTYEMSDIDVVEDTTPKDKYVQVGSLRKDTTKIRRGILPKSLEFFGIETYYDEDDVAVKETYTYPNGVVKTRYIQDKEFSCSGSPDQLFGQNLFAPSSSRMVTIVEGELDCASAWQMLKGGGYNNPVVSVPSATPSKKMWANCYDWLNSFEKIILSVDNDKAGDELAERISKMFLGKVYRVNHGIHKDANDFLQAGKGEDYKKAWWAAKRVKPDSILSNPEDYVALYDDSPDFEYFKTGIPELDDKMLGICKGYITLIQAKSGLGKCLHPDQGVMMSSGKIKKAKDVVVGDELMGDDSTYRKVLGTTTGQQEMFKVTPVKGEPFTCNRSHVISLVNSTSGDKFDISIDDYLKQSKTFKNTHRLYRVGVERFSVEAGKERYNPYLVGVYLGDGHKHRAGITLGKSKYCMIDYLTKCLEVTGHTVRLENMGSCKELTFTKGDFFYKYMKGYLSNERTIPDEYLYADRHYRLALLAGLLDTDGSLHDDGVGVEITQKSKLLSEQITFLARSLGYAAYMKEKIGTIKSLGFEGTYWRVNISGDLTELPTRRLKFKSRKQIKNVLHTGFTIESLGVGNYAGFEVDGNHRFLLDDFTVTHNSELMRYFEYQLLKNSKYRVASCRKEETKLRSLLGLVSYELESNVTLKKLVDEKGLEDDVKVAIKELTEDERFVTFSIDETQSNDETMAQLNYMISAMGVDYIFIEPIQDIVSGANSSEKEGKLSDLITRMGNLCGDTGVGIVVIAHENNDGGAMYSRMITMKSGFKITLSGDRESDDPTERNRTYLEIKEKNRVGLGFGKAGCVDFDIETYMLKPVIYAEPETPSNKGDW